MKRASFIPMCSFLAGLFFFACTGPQGDVGPIGPQGVAGKDGTVGAAGTAGATGPKGDQGAAKVVYTAWKSFALDAIPAPIAGDYTYFSNANKTEPAFTKEAIDQGVLLTYFKINSTVFENSTYVLKESITASSNVISYFKIPGRTQSRFEDYHPIQVFYDASARRENFFDPGIYFFKRASFTSGSFVSELQNLTNDQQRALAKDIPQYRHVVIYGSTKGRMAGIDLNDYAAVKAAFNIAD